MVSQEQSVVFEELIVAIDFAGRLQGDDMEQNANPQTNTPAWAHGVEKAAVIAMSCGDQLGASTALAIISGSAFPDGPHEIPLGGHGGENIDLANEGAAPVILVDLGMRCIPSAPYRVDFQVQGDTQDEFGCAIELIFQDDEVETPKRWVSRAATTAAVNVEVQGTDVAQAAATVPPFTSTEIGGIIGCGAGDMAALGVHAIVAKTSVGTVDDNSFLLAGVGGELIIGAGAHISPSQRTHCHYKVKESTNIMVELMGIFEAGVMDGIVSLGFVIP
jgi:hypothetical protein